MPNTDSQLVGVLVVDDQEPLRRLLVRTLSENGFEPFEAESASQGLLQFHAHRDVIKIAIIDMVMPHTSGLDLAAEFFRVAPEVRILYISGCVDSVAMDVISRQSPDSVLFKPFTPSELMERVRRITTSRAGA